VDELFRVGKAMIVSSLLLMAGSFLVQGYEFSRSMIVMFGFLATFVDFTLVTTYPAMTGATPATNGVSDARPFRYSGYSSTNWSVMSATVWYLLNSARSRSSVTSGISR